MGENHDHMLEKLDLILRLVWDCNVTLKRIKSEGESQHINSVSSDNVRELEVEATPEPELEIIDEPEPYLKVIDESDPEPEMEEFLIETPVDLPAKLIMELLSSSPTMSVPLSSRPADAYDLLQIFLNEASSHEFVVLVCDSFFNVAD